MIFSSSRANLPFISTKLILILNNFLSQLRVIFIPKNAVEFTRLIFLAENNKLIKLIFVYVVGWYFILADLY
jgi:hypothetical protein